MFCQPEFQGPPQVLVKINQLSDLWVENSPVCVVDGGFPLSLRKRKPRVPPAKDYVMSKPLTRSNCYPSLSRVSVQSQTKNVA